MDVDKLNGGCDTAIEKLKESSFFVRKKTGLILTYREVDHTISSLKEFCDESLEYSKWVQCDKLAQAIIGLYFSDDRLEQV